MTSKEYEELMKKLKKKALNGIVWTSVSGVIFTASMLNLAINGGYSDDYKEDIQECLTLVRESDAFQEYKDVEIEKLDFLLKSGKITIDQYNNSVKVVSSYKNLYNNRKKFLEEKIVDGLEDLVENYKDQFRAEAITSAGAFISTGILTYGGSKFAINADKIVTLMEKKKELEQDEEMENNI